MAAYWSQYLGMLADNQLKYASANPTPGGGAGGISGVVPDYGYDGGGGCQTNLSHVSGNVLLCPHGSSGS
jgi:hypothetical protein